MKNIILSIFATNYGTILRFIVAGIVGIIVAMLSRVGFTLSDEQLVQLAGATTVIISGLIGEYVLKSQGQSIGQMQASLQKVTPAVLVDKWAGPATVRAVEIASDAVERFHERNKAHDSEPPTVMTDLSSPQK